jgi:hypothetical protein
LFHLVIPEEAFGFCHFVCALVLQHLINISHHALHQSGLIKLFPALAADNFLQIKVGF